MINLLEKLIKEKRVLILGFGMEGKSTYNLLKKVGSFSALDIADKNPNISEEEAVVYSGDNYLDNIEMYDIVFKSPGIILPKNYKEYNCQITSQTEVFLEHYNRQVIGITGTKGKSTVSTLIYHVLSSNNIPCILAGNIGKPVFDILDDITPATILVLELSCHQLDICRFSPALSVFLNLYEDHLDHYKTFENYARTKKNIYLHQHPLDILYCDATVKPAVGESVSRAVIVDKTILPFDSFTAIDVVKLYGEHNLKNCAFVYSIAKTFSITDDEFISSIRSYAPLRHRLEFIGNKEGIDFYDDSISTTNESTINAVKTIPNASTVLVGGMDRGIDYTGLVEYLASSSLANIICMYDSGKRIFEMLQSSQNVKPTANYCNTLYEAAELAQKITPVGKACILSPAAASYGEFKNFEERGNMFRQLVIGDK